MAGPPLMDRPAGDVFVGRERELAELAMGLEDAISGRGRMALLVGEPGIGKTRLAEELATLAMRKGARVVFGRSHETEGAPAYWPWVQVIRAYARQAGDAELLEQMGPGAPDVAELVPEFRDRFPSLPPLPSLDPDQARFRLFDSITGFLQNAARDAPLVVVIDDLHWADRSSLLLLEFVAREVRTSPVLLVGTYRDVGLGRRHPLSRTIAELAGVSTRVVLPGLCGEDVGRFIELTSGTRPNDGLVRAVCRETEGNPFFVSEVVRLLVSEGWLDREFEDRAWNLKIPHGVREVVGRRLDRLSDACPGCRSVHSRFLLTSWPGLTRPSTWIPGTSPGMTI